jgi:ABC-type dipeptide/oligopeptide/nickel transport system permease subunit
VSTTNQPKPELLGSQAGLGAAVAVESGPELGEQIAVRARGYWEQVWKRFKRDKVAVGSIFFIVLLVLACFPGAWIAERLIGHGPNDLFFDGLDSGLNPVGPMSWVTHPETGERQLLILGADGTLGRDEFLRLLYGGRVSLQVAVFATLGVMLIGTFLGAIAGYYRGWIDTIVARLTEITMAFPALLFVIALASTVGQRLNGVTFGVFGEGVVTLVLVFWVFGWFYPARIIRAQVLSLREKEFIEAARMTGASDFRIIRSHLLPHLVAPIIVFSTLIVAGYVLAEAGLSFLGVGIQPPTADWGSMVRENATLITYGDVTPLLPAAAIALLTVAVNFVVDWFLHKTSGLRDEH